MLPSLGPDSLESVFGQEIFDALQHYQPPKQTEETAVAPAKASNEDEKHVREMPTSLEQHL